MPRMLRWAHLPECENAPSDWVVASFSQVATVIAGQAPPSETYNEKGEGLPFLQGNADFTEKYPKPSLWCTAPQKIAQRGDTLISVRAPVGEVNRADQTYAIGRGLAAIRANDSNSDFLYHALQRWRWSLQRVAQGTTFDAVTARHFAQVYVAVPQALEEQRIIARILDAVDLAIESARVAVKRAHDLRRGLLQSAFEFETGNEPMKKTDAGMIPQSWDAVRGKQAFVLLSGGNASVNALRQAKADEEVNAWFMKVDDFNLPENQRHITRSKIGFNTVHNPKFNLLPVNTVVIAKRGAAILKNRVRTTRVPVALDPNLMGIQMLEIMIPEFFRYQLEWRNLPRYLEDSGIPQLNNKDLYPRYFLKAPRPRQEEIVVRLSVAETYEDALIAKLQAFESLKKSLLHDLLTGKVRVNHLNIDNSAIS